MVELRLKKKDSEKLKLIKFRNPYGNANPWKGAWNVNSKEWRNLEANIKQKYLLSLDPEGEFYMSFRDFYTYFGTVCIGNLKDNNIFLFYDEYDCDCVKIIKLCNKAIRSKKIRTWIG